MKAPSAVLFTFVSAAAILGAQNGNQQSGSIFRYDSLTPKGAAHASVVAQSPMNRTCPISMRAQHLSDGNLMKAGRLEHPAGIGQRLYLTLVNPDSRQIASAMLTIQGVTPNGRLMQASPAQAGNSDAKRTLTVAFSPGPDNTVSTDVWVPGMTAVEAIEVNSLRYADDSTWKLASDLACRIAPDGFMQIAGR
jgi:hypothetical protein